MKRHGSAIVVILIVMLGSVVLAGVASTIALARAGSGRLNADLSSALRADYSADPNGTRLAQLSQDIIDAAREDAENLEEGARGEPDLVPIFRPGDAEPRSQRYENPRPPLLVSLNLLQSGHDLATLLATGEVCPQRGRLSSFLSAGDPYQGFDGKVLCLRTRDREVGLDQLPVLPDQRLTSAAILHMPGYPGRFFFAESPRRVPQQEGPVVTNPSLYIHHLLFLGTPTHREPSAPCPRGACRLSRCNGDGMGGLVPPFLAPKALLHGIPRDSGGS